MTSGMGIAEMFRVGGVWMYAILALALLGWGLSAVALVVMALTKKALPTIGIAVVVGFLGLATAGTGVLGYFVGMSEVEGALEHASPENRARLQAKGEQYAKSPLYFGIGASSVPVLAGFVTLIVGVRRRGD